MQPNKRGRKLLIASLGVAAVSYVACGDGSVVANLMISPTPDDAGGGNGGSSDTGGGGAGGTGGSVAGAGGTGGTAGTIVGNLMPQPVPDAGASDAPADTTIVFYDVLVANLIAPPPPDAKSDGNK